MNVCIRNEEPKDIDTIYELNASAFESNEEAVLVNRLRGSGSLTLSLVAEVNGHIVGHIAFSPIVIEGANDMNLFALGPMAVAPSEQRKEIGSKLIRHGLEKLGGSGADAVFLIGHPEYYPKFGFKPSASTFGIKSTYDVLDEVFMALELAPGVLEKVTGVARYSKEFEEWEASNESICH